MTRGIEPMTVGVFKLYCQSDGCSTTIVVRGTMAVSALAEAQRSGWSTGGRKNLCRDHRGQREPARPGRRTAAAAAASKK